LHWICIRSRLLPHLGEPPQSSPNGSTMALVLSGSRYGLGGGSLTRQGFHGAAKSAANPY
jgi:hypothetical protein